MKIGIFGCTGKMGIEIAKFILMHDNHELSAAFARKDNPNIGQNISSIIGPYKSNVVISSDIDLLCINSDAVIDFTSADSMLEIAEACLRHNKILVSGSTGLKNKHFDKLNNFAKYIPILWSANMSFLVHIMIKLVEETSIALGDQFDIDILEMHHRNKKDAPSGTAIMIGEAIAKIKNRNLKEISVLNRNEIGGPRNIGDISFSSIRGGEISGEHKVIFSGENEILELTHKSINRQIYASGAIKAVEYLSKKKNGFYSMKNVVFSDY